MDLSKLRDAALQHGEDEEAVTVDTRALIDKVLARYSGEWTTLRELIQNAADAQATTVKIKWETFPSTTVPQPATTNQSELLKHVITNHTLRRLLVQNNGQPFTKTDWGRLKRIAEGNPDETKIGAFGVGFYSVFADCEEPFVSSGNEAMTFYWKGNALFTRKLQLPEGQGSSDTIFMLDYRNSTTALPNLLSVGQFLATSLTFVALQNVEFWIDDWMILKLTKKTSPSVDVPIPSDIETRTKEQLMRLKSVDRVSTQIDAVTMRAINWKPKASMVSKLADTYGGFSQIEAPSLKSFFSRFTSSSSSSQAGSRGSKQLKEEKEAPEAKAEDLTSTTTSSIFLRVSSAVVSTHVSVAFSKELERATKKPPPKTTKLSILTSSYDETQASQNSVDSSESNADVFASVLPSKKPGGRIFIGFPTTQTTGGGMHISAPSVIPTVEREAIDLNARWVRNWNIEMLRVAGILTRLAFSGEMADLHAKLQKAVAAAGKGSIPSQSDVDRFTPEALHILNTYTFKDSTPSSYVAQIIEEAFWTAYKKASIEVYSSRGVLPSSKVRMGSEELAKFVDGIPVILNDMKSAPLIRKLEDFGLLQGITIPDIKQELNAKALNKGQLVHFLTWAGKTAISGELDPPSRRSLLDVAVATVSENGAEDSGEIITLSTIRNFLSTNKIPANLPLPPTTLPFAITCNIPIPHLQALGWEQLEITPWLKYLIESAPSMGDEQNLTKSADFAAKVLVVLSKNWDNLAPASRTQVTAMLQDITAIPTKMGMKKPNEAFFPTVKLFDDLPIVQGCQGVKDKFLQAIGVRKTLDLDTIFTRLLTPAKEGAVRWSHMELIKYLASVRDDIPSSDMRKLKDSRICPAEAGPPGLEPTKGTTQLFKVSELFEPKDTLRALRLPILQWPGPPGSFRASSQEGRFLLSLGLRPHPSVPELIDMMSGQDPAVRNSAMTYFIANHHTNGYVAFNVGDTQKAILPLQGAEMELVRPSQCYVDERAAVLGFNILSRPLQVHASKFGVARDPPILECVNRLIGNPPKDRQSAVALFGYFATRLGDLNQNCLVKLRDSPIVPVKRVAQSGSGSKESMSMLKPVNCYLGSSTVYGDIFDFVDFDSNANAFLYKCGAKSEPTKVEIARLACNEPARLLSILQSPERYLNLLRSLAEDLPTLKKDRELFAKMKTSAFLLASKEISPARKTRGDDAASITGIEEEEAPIKQYQLAAPSQIVVLDDYISYRLFKDSLVVAPEEDLLENFYMALGSQLLGRLVQEDLKVGSPSEKQEAATWLRKHVLERSKLFLYEYAKHSKDAILHDAKWLEEHMVVQVVRNLALRRSLRGSNGPSHLEKRSAASFQTRNGHWILYVGLEGKPDMYQVGQAVCQLLLTRPSQQAYFFFEPFLKLDLLDLRARGYNVDRILRLKAAEARIAEEERRKALEAEQRRIKEREQEWARQGEVAAAARQERNRTPEPVMPGAFGSDSPEDRKTSPPDSPHGPKDKGRSLFSSLSKRFGFDNNHKDEDNMLPPPPPEKPNNISSNPLLPGPAAAGGSSGNGSEQSKKKKNDDGRVTSPAVVQQNLLNAINSTRAHDSSELFSPPNTTEVKEQGTYCDSNAEHDLNFAAEAPRGMRVFVTKNHSAAFAPDKFLMASSASIAAFESLLRDVAGVYGLSVRSMHMFYDEAGNTIAFNSKGAIFCNLRWFMQLHSKRLLDLQQAGGESSSSAAAQGQQHPRVEATTWWWVVVAHELAHNLVKIHNSDHSYYTESFIQQFFPKMMTMAATWTASPLSQRGSTSIPVTTSSSASASATAASASAGSHSLPPPPAYSQEAPPRHFARHLLD